MAVGRDFFCNIFLKGDQWSLLIYLKEINSTELANVTDFFYNGEANVTHMFLETARELQVRGLCHNFEGRILRERASVAH